MRGLAGSGRDVLDDASWLPYWAQRSTANVWPHVKQSYPHAELEIVGKHPNNEVLHLAKHDGIHVTGAVPDVRSYVAKADIVIAPLQIARGIQNKVLEALSMAKPVIASPKASHGINASHNQHLLIADTPAEWLWAAMVLPALLRHRYATDERDAILPGVHGA